MHIATVTQDSAEMVYRHPERHSVLLRHRLRVAIVVDPLQNANTLKLWTTLLQQISIIQRQPTLLDQLHRRNAVSHFSARCHPKNVVEGHGLFGVNGPSPTGMRKEFFSVSVDDYSDASGNLVRVGGDLVHAGPECHPWLSLNVSLSFCCQCLLLELLMQRKEDGTFENVNTRLPAPL